MKIHIFKCPFRYSKIQNFKVYHYISSKHYHVGKVVAKNGGKIGFCTFLEAFLMLKGVF
jgi:hypothetical protein